MQIVTVTRKVYMSILTVMLVFITMVATTFAWVGIFTYNQTSPFDLNLKTQDLESDYYLSISASGEEGTYTDTANLDIIKEQILINMGKDLSVISYDKASNSDKYYETIDDLFNKITLDPVTVNKNEMINNLFYTLDYKKKNQISSKATNLFFRFNLYLSVEPRDENSLTSDVTNKLDVVLSNIQDTLTGTQKVHKLANDFYYPSENFLYPISVPNDYISQHQEICINAISATRLAIAVYNPIKRTEDYQSSEEPEKIVIYQGGTQNPTYDETSNTYSFGGILPEEYNLALTEHKKINKIGSDKLNVPDEMINRGDLELTEENNLLIDSDFGFGIVNGEKMKMKLTIFFWYEGWDADCFEIISGQSTKINLTFSTGDVKSE